MKSKMINLIKGFLVLVSMLVGTFVLLIIYLMITDYSPKDHLNIALMDNPTAQINTGDELKILTWNIGYAGLDQSQDFFMDGGHKSKPDSTEVVKYNLEGMVDVIKAQECDVIMLQEVDLNSDRTYNIDELKYLSSHLGDYGNAFAYNYKVKYVPVPLPPLGKIEAGQMTLFNTQSYMSQRLALPGQYAFPKSLVMLDRCALVNYQKIEDSDRLLVLINAHFSAYDDGSIRSQQMAYIKAFIKEEYEKGNYVILGGDFNQTFDFVDDSKFPLYQDGKFYTPYKISSDWVMAGWKWGVGTNAPTYRLLNGPYEEGITQVGIIDGFLVSPNLKITSVEVLDQNFLYSDHNPVMMTLKLK